ncbi:hypothetical protein ZIOFF_016680 [Zingiber officinale]|uniref:Coronatine-insensitive protein 1 n=1 Tax=Zingiber officinale TaxID=94328 RepID=A0A8J5LVJ1_ZINOF|nr:hypothetical protein ZIOFF_016680 [Zingiber officinale]
MSARTLNRVMSFGISDLALEFVLGYVDDPRDREAVSLVCKKWYQIDALSRKHVTIAICYSTSPGRLRRRFPNLESLQLKGKPRAAMFNLIPEDWGGYVGPWIREIAEAFNCLKSLHLRRMIVKDEDIRVLVKARGHMLESLKLDKCSGLSTDGLLLVARSCSDKQGFLVIEHVQIDFTVKCGLAYTILLAYIIWFTGIWIGSVGLYYFSLVEFGNQVFGFDIWLIHLEPHGPSPAHDLFLAKVQLVLIEAFAAIDCQCSIVRDLSCLVGRLWLRQWRNWVELSLSIGIHGCIFWFSLRHEKQCKPQNSFCLSAISQDDLQKIHMLVQRICLRILSLEESSISGNDAKWIHELAVNNSVLETLNFYMTELRVAPEDLELLAKNCRSLVSLKISECDISYLVSFFLIATKLEEFGGGSFNDQVGDLDKYKKIQFPPKLCCVGLIFMGKNEMEILFPFAAALKKLDLQYTFLSTEDHCQLIQRCPNLEVLEVRDVIGDRGLEVVAQTCKKLRRLRIERGDDDQGLEDEQGCVSQAGLSSLAQGCLELEYLAVYVSDITNAALECLGTYSKNLCDFRLVLLDREQRITDLPLDNGVRALLKGCAKIRRFALYLRPGGLSDVGLGYIGQYSNNVRWILMGNIGESDRGLLRFSQGCPRLQKLELRSCCFTERALAMAALRLPSLRYLWVQGYVASPFGNDLLLMARAFWNIEFIPPKHDVNETEDRRGNIESQAQILAYYSLAGKRVDCPDSVIPLHPA